MEKLGQAFFFWSIVELNANVFSKCIETKRKVGKCELALCGEVVLDTVMYTN